MSKPKTFSAELDHFLELARRGTGAGASGGERRCAALAEVIMEHAGGIDAQAYTGLCQFAAMVSVDYSRARRLLRTS
jgi:hypothetical protein